MVLRPSDAPRTVPDHIRDARARTSDLQRQQGRGASALRNRTHTLYLDPASANPVLTPTRVDSGVAFRDGALEVVSGDGTAYADMALRGVDARGQVRGQSFSVSGNAIFCPERDGAIRWAVDGALEIANGDGAELKGVRTSRVHANELVSNGGIAAAGGMSADVYRVDGNAIYSQPRDGAIRWESQGALSVVSRDGTAGRGVFATNVSSNYPSWREWKTDRTPIAERLGRPAVDVIGDLELASFRYDPDTCPNSVDDHDTEWVGMMLNEVPELLRTRMPPDLDQSPGDYDQDKHASWYRDGMLTLALAAIQEQQTQIEALRDEVAELRAGR